MGDPELNCLLLICCPPEARVDLLARLLAEEGYCTREKGKLIAAWFFRKFDVAPAGKLYPLVQAVAELARGEDFKP